MKWTKLVSLTILVAIAGCATNRPVTIQATFDENQATTLLAPGPNKVTGSGLIRQGGGGVVTCAGGVVYLMPITAYAREWATLVYGSAVQGYHSTGARGIDFPNADRRFFSAVRSTNCNASGFFEFSDVADGDFYVFTKINWRVGGEIQGGSIMRSASVAGGKKLDITLTP